MYNNSWKIYRVEVLQQQLADAETHNEIGRYDHGYIFERSILLDFFCRNKSDVYYMRAALTEMQNPRAQRTDL